MIMPEKIVIEFDGEKLKEFAENIRICILKIGSPDTEWAEQYSALKAFLDAHKRWPTQRANGEEGLRAVWVNNQRQGFKKSTLSPERVKRLEELPGWSWDSLADIWDQTFTAVQIFHGKNKRWPAQKTTTEEAALAQWIGHQRRAHKKNILSPERVKRLEELPDWSWDPHADTWDQNFVAAEIFHDKHKRWPKIGAAGEEGALAHWASAQRHAFKKSTLSSARIKRLEGLPGWSWDAIAYIWDQRFEEVGTFCSAHGRWPTHGVAGEEGVLAKWVSTQRRVQNKGLLSPERTLRLNSIPGWSWDAFTDKWNRNFAAVQVFHDKYKRWPEQRAAGEEAMLARWVSTQRKAFKKSSLSPERTTRLNSISGWTWSATEQSADCVLKVSAPNR
jgi:hypothetical protein